MADYHGPDAAMYIEEKKWLLKCRVEDIPVKANRRWQFENIMCSYCDMNAKP